MYNVVCVIGIHSIIIESREREAFIYCYLEIKHIDEKIIDNKWQFQKGYIDSKICRQIETLI